MSEILIFGHKSPDTDSVTSAVTLSYLKNKLGFNTTPKMLGSLNNETKFVLEYFNVKAPEYLNDVKLKIKDTAFQKNHYLNQNDSILKSYLYMNEHNISSLPVVDENQKLVGMVSIKDIAKYQILNNSKILNTSLENISETVSGEVIIRFDDHLNINCNNELIINNEYFPKNNNDVKLLIITDNFELNKNQIEQLKENKINVIKSMLSKKEVISKIMMANSIYEITTNSNLVYFSEDTYITDFIEVANETKYSNYPIVDSDNTCLGTLRLPDLGSAKSKRVILVDHNELSQSVDGLEEAEILEVIDHHKIGGIHTKEPISFRNMPVGSTNTIIYQMYQENNIEIPREIAGLMLSGILSDTLILTSPTTTELDKKVVLELEKIAGVNHYDYGISMFEAGSSLKGKTVEEILFSDFKDFNIKDYKVGIGQVFTMNINDIKEQANEFLKAINETAEKSNYEIVALFITDIIKNGSYVLFNEKSKKIIAESFNVENIDQLHYLDNCVSRKKQIIPPIMKILEK